MTQMSRIICVTAVILVVMTVDCHALWSLKGVQHPAEGEINRGSPGYIAACLVVRDITEDLVEWLEYYRWLGVDKVYLYDHESQPPALSTVLSPFVSDGFVDYTYFHASHTKKNASDKTPVGWPESGQGFAYDDCVKRSRHRHTWLMLFDADEFLILKNTTTAKNPKKGASSQLAALLEDYKGYGALAINWIMFSGKPHKKRPQGGVLANYQYCLEADNNLHKHVKLIIEPKYVKTVHCPHMVRYRNPKKHYTVDELKRRVKGPFTASPTHQRAALYHYSIKSDEEFEKKKQRGTGDGRRKGDEYRTLVTEQATSICTKAAALAQVCCPSLKQTKPAAGDRKPVSDPTDTAAVP